MLWCRKYRIASYTGLIQVEAAEIPKGYKTNIAIGRTPITEEQKWVTYE